MSNALERRREALFYSEAIQFSITIEEFFAAKDTSFFS